MTGPVAAIGGRRAWLAGAMLAAAIAAAAHVAAFWPGIMVWDAIRQYGEALAGRYDDWHPPAMDWLWRRLLPIHAGPAAPMALQALLYWAGVALLAADAARVRRFGLAVATVAVASMPIALVLVGTVLKDSLMAGALLLAAGLIAWRRPGALLPAVAAGTLLLGAATLRFNALPACLPLALRLLPARRRLATGVCAAGALLLAMPLANRLLHAEPSGVELSLIVYDLGGIGRYTGEDQFPSVTVADPVAVNARCYSPVAWDSYAWWVDDPCPIGFAAVRDAFRARGTAPVVAWLTAVLRHPLAYARHRLGHFARNVRLIDAGDLHGLSLRSDPNRWGFAVAPDRVRDTIGGLATGSLRTPLGWPACWLALALSALLLCPRAEAGLARPLAWSALLYGLSYLPLSVATEVRYHLWTTTAAALSVAMTIDALVRRGALARLRSPAAWAPLLLVTAVAIAFRAG